WCSGSAVMRSPRKCTSPAVGSSAPVSRLMSVVLPAPLGPISAWRAPEAMARLTASTATSAPKRRVRFVVASAGVAGLCSCERAGGREFAHAHLLQRRGDGGHDIAHLVGIDRADAADAERLHLRELARIQDVAARAHLVVERLELVGAIG